MFAPVSEVHTRSRNVQSCSNRWLFKWPQYFTTLPLEYLNLHIFDVKLL
jgi:hypothetical protein